MEYVILLVLVVLVFALALCAVLQQSRKRLLIDKWTRLMHVEALETTLKATGAALDRQKEVSHALFDMLLAQISATTDLKEENDRLGRELAMAEEKIHVLAPPTAKKKKSKRK